MNLDALELIEEEGRRFLVDVNTSKPIGLSDEAYRVLSLLKLGVSLRAVESTIGRETVCTVLAQLEELQHRGKVSESRRPFREEALEYLDTLLEGPPLAVEGILMVSQACNLACHYCYGGDAGAFGSRGLMSQETAERCLRYFLSLNPTREFQKIVFLGGEPFLNFRVIRRAVELWNRWRADYPGRELYFSTTTNGTTLTPEIVQFVKDHGIGITVSIDGPAPMHDTHRVFANGDGSFDRVMAGIDLLRQANVPINVRATLTRRTDIDHLYRFLEKQGFELEYLSPVDFPMVERRADYQLDVQDFRRHIEAQRRWTRAGCVDVKNNRTESFKARQLSMIFHSLRTFESNFPFRCTAAWGLLAFDISGAIFPCQRFVGQTPYQIGDIDHGLDGQRIVDFYRRFLDASDDCDNCWAVHLCRRRCFQQKARPNGTFERIPEPVCDIYRDCYSAAMIYAQDLQRFARGHSCDLEGVLSRYDTERLMGEFRTRREGASHGETR